MPSADENDEDNEDYKELTEGHEVHDHVPPPAYGDRIDINSIL